MNSSMKFFGVSFLYVVLIFGLSFVPYHPALAEDTEGITIQRDVYLNSPILGVENLPNELTVSLYDSQTGLTPLATQAFPRGAYTLDFELSKSNGVELGPIARLKVNFTNKLNLGDDPDNPTRVSEVWSEVSVNGKPIVGRAKVSDETMVQLLLASDASLATYVTFAYEGDTNPLTTIYKSLPLASGQSANEFVSSVFSAVSSEDRSLGNSSAPYWDQNGTSVYYNDGNVGIGTASPQYHFELGGSGSGKGVLLNTGSEAFFGWADRSLYPTDNANRWGWYATDGKTCLWDNKSLANRLVVTNSGTVGIGTDSPDSQYALEVKGNGVVLTTGTDAFYGWADRSLYPTDNANRWGWYATDGKTCLWDNKSSANRLVVTNSGGIGIGTSSPTYTLAVNGTIGCKELTVTSTGWADFVFQDDYRLAPLSEVEDFISTNKHLPGIPTEADVKEQGVSVGDMSSKLLQKVEELTLYLIDLKKENDSLKAQLVKIQEQLKGHQD